MANATTLHPTDVWIDAANSVTSGWNKFTDWLGDPFGITSKIITITHIMVTLYLIYRVQSLMATMCVLQMHTAKAATTLTKVSSEQLRQRILTALIPPAVQTQETVEDEGSQSNPFPYTLLNHSPQLSNDYHVVDIFIWITLLTLLIYVVVKLARQKVFANTTEITLEFISNQDRVSICLGHLPHMTQYYTFKSTDFVEKVHISWGPLPRVTLVWPTLQAKHNHLKTKVKVPLSCRVHWLTARRLRKLIRSSFELLVFVKYSEHPGYTLLPLVGSQWTNNPLHPQLDQPPEYI